MSLNTVSESMYISISVTIKLVKVNSISLIIYRIEAAVKSLWYFYKT